MLHLVNILGAEEGTMAKHYHRLNIYSKEKDRPWHRTRQNPFHLFQLLYYLSGYSSNMCHLQA